MKVICDNEQEDLFTLINVKPPLIIVTKFYRSANFLSRELHIRKNDWIWVGCSEDLNRKVRGIYGVPYTEYHEFPSFIDGEYNFIKETRGLRFFPADGLLRLVGAAVIPY